MKKHYLQSICLFSYIVPLLFSLVLIALVFFARSVILGGFSDKQKIYTTEQAQLITLKKLKTESKEKEVQLDQWKNLSETADSFTDISAILRQSISDNSPTKTLQITQSKRTKASNAAINAASSNCEFGIEGTYSEIQRSLSQLESTMPNLMLNSMTIATGKNSKLLNLNLKYTIWEKSQ